MASGHQVPSRDKGMDKMWNTPASLQTPEMVKRRRVAALVAAILAIGGVAYKYNTDPEWESALDATFHRLGGGLELAAGRR